MVDYNYLLPKEVVQENNYVLLHRQAERLAECSFEPAGNIVTFRMFSSDINQWLICT